MWLLRERLWMLRGQRSSSTRSNYRGAYRHLRVQDLSRVVHSTSWRNNACLVVPLSLLAVDLRGHCLRCLSLLRRVDFTGSVHSIGWVLSWPQWAAWGANILAWGAVSESVVPLRTRGRSRVFSGSSRSLVYLLFTVGLAARSRLSLGCRLRAVWSSWSTLGKDCIGSLLVLALLLDPVLFRVVLPLLMQLQPLFASAADLFGSLLLKM